MEASSAWCGPLGAAVVPPQFLYRGYDKNRYSEAWFSRCKPGPGRVSLNAQSSCHPRGERPIGYVEEFLFGGSFLALGNLR
jgi:hypothetical protein